MNFRWLYIAILLQFSAMVVFGWQEQSNAAFIALALVGSSVVLLTFGLEKLEKMEEDND